MTKEVQRARQAASSRQGSWGNSAGTRVQQAGPVQPPVPSKTSCLSRCRSAISLRMNSALALGSSQDRESGSCPRGLL